MKRVIVVIILMLPIALFAQKVKLGDKTNQVTIDGVNSFKIERSGCGWGMPDCHFDVFDNDGNKVIRINYKEFKSPMERKASNPEGIVRYYEYIFLDSKSKAEIEYLYMKEEKVAKNIVKNNLIVDGKLNDKAVEEFVLVHGTDFSARASRNR